jgi:phenylalanyl-tRNA synthetase beta chain
MKVPISWLKDFVDIDLPITELAHQMTMAGLEVEEIRFVGLPIPGEGSRDASLTGLEWDREKLVVASISEVMPHPMRTGWCCANSSTDNRSRWY